MKKIASIFVGLVMVFCVQPVSMPKAVLATKSVKHVVSVLSIPLNWKV